MQLWGDLSQSHKAWRPRTRAKAKPELRSRPGDPSPPPSRRRARLRGPGPAVLVEDLDLRGTLGRPTCHEGAGQLQPDSNARDGTATPGKLTVFRAGPEVLPRRQEVPPPSLASAGALERHLPGGGGMGVEAPPCAVEAQFRQVCVLLTPA